MRSTSTSRKPVPTGATTDVGSWPRDSLEGLISQEHAMWTQGRQAAESARGG